MPKSGYHYEMCEFIHKEFNYLRKHQRFFKPGCLNCILSVTNTENLLSLTFFMCQECSDATNVVRKTKYMLYFYKMQKPVVDKSFSVECNECTYRMKRNFENQIKISIQFCKWCSQKFCTVTKGKHVIYFY